MKKNNILQGLAVLLIVAGGLFAIGNSQPKALKVYDEHWYIFNGDPTILSEVQDPTNYEYTGGIPGCAEESKVCAVLAQGPAGSGQHPSTFSSTLLDELEAAVEGNNESDKIRMKD